MSAIQETPIAIVGIGCRFPGGADSPDALWRLLLNRTDTVGTVPADRWDADALKKYQHPDDADRFARGCFVEGDIWAWEPAALSASPWEGVVVDPQHRLATEVSWEAVEHAGIPIDRMRGSRTGVYLGMYAVDALMSSVRPVRDWVEGLNIFGSHPGNAPGRIAFALDLRGPVMAIETLCSSGLVAVHEAARALSAGECEMALAGAVMLMTSPETLHYEAQWLTSKQGRCFAFDERADGFVRGEGCGMVLLKRLDDARRDGDRVLAVIRGSAVTSDGQSERMTAPSTVMQQEAARLALARAGVGPADVGLVEAHGAGTPTGDPIEYTSVNSVYGKGSEPCALGSVKTNIGHSEPVAGIAGLIKAVLSVYHGQIPANLNFRAWHPSIPVDPSSRLFVPTETTPWPLGSDTRLAGVCSSGLAGTNAHVIIEQPAQRTADSRVPTPRAQQDAAPRLFLLSTASPQALPAAAGRLADAVEQHRPPLADLAHTLAVRRMHATERLAVSAADTAELTQRLRAFAQGDVAGVVSGRPVLPPEHAGPVFVFTGQGSQSPGMCRDLLDADPVFTAVVDEIEPLMAAEAGFSVRQMLAEPDLLVGDDKIQPILFAVQLGLAAMWRSWGITPSAVIGLSLGEISAAVVAGGLSLEDGVKVSCRRSKLALNVQGGAMASVLLGANEVAADIAAAGAERVSLAVLTAPGTTVISGDRDQVEQLVAAWQARDIGASVIRVDYASHSAHVDPILDPIREQMREITPTVPGIPFYGTAYTDPRAPLPLDGDYWATNLREPVRFTTACAAALQDGHRLFIECSPHPLGVRAIGDIASRAHIGDAVALGSLRKDSNDTEAFLTHVAAAHCAGTELDWAGRYPGELVDAPTFTWHRSHHRPEPAYELVAPNLVGARQHSLLGGHVTDPDQPGRHLWQTPVGPERVPWLKDHSVAGTPVMAGAGLAEMMLAAAAQILGTDHVTLTGLGLSTPLLLDPEPDVTVHAITTPDGTVDVQVLSRSGADPVTHARATAAATSASNDPLAAHILDPQEWENASVSDLYAYLRARHQVVHGPAFAGLERLRLHPERDEVLANVRIPDAARISAWMMRLHPVLLDTAIQAVPAVWRLRYQLDPGPIVVAGIDRVDVFGPTQHARLAHIRLTGADERSCSADGILADADGHVLARITGIHLANITPPAERFTARLSHLALTPADEPVTARAEPGAWLVLTEEGDPWAPQLAQHLGTLGADVHQVALPLAQQPTAETFPPALTGVVLAVGPGMDGEPPQAAQERVLRLCTVLRTLAAQQDPPQVWVAAMTGTISGLRTAGLRGVLRTATYEYPQLAASIVTADTPAATSQLAVELLSEDTEVREVAWQAGRRHLLRLRTTPPVTVNDTGAEQCTIHPDGAYLVTGGLGGIGLLTAGWLSHRGAAHVITIGRSKPTESAAAYLDELRANGTRVTVVTGDIADAGTVQQAVAEATGDGHLLRGVIHSAAVVEDATLDTLTEDLVQRVWRGKAEGAWQLHHATAAQPLDFFAVYSSQASQLGSPGQATYAAANAFLDDLVAWRTAQGLPATAIHWGAWAQVGAGQGMAQRGFTMIKPEDGIDALDRILAVGYTHIAYSPIDLDRWLTPYPQAAGSALFTQALGNGHAPTEEATGLMAAQLLDASDDQSRRTLLHDHIIESVRGLLGSSTVHIAPTTSFVMLGIDSLTAMQLRQRLQRSLGITIDTAVLWTKPTAAALTDFLLDRMGHTARLTPVS